MKQYKQSQVDYILSQHKRDHILNITNNKYYNRNAFIDPLYLLSIGNGHNFIIFESFSITPEFFLNNVSKVITSLESYLMQIKKYKETNLKESYFIYYETFLRLISYNNYSFENLIKEIFDFYNKKEISYQELFSFIYYGSYSLDLYQYNFISEYLFLSITKSINRFIQIKFDKYTCPIKTIYEISKEILSFCPAQKEEFTFLIDKDDDWEIKFKDLFLENKEKEEYLENNQNILNDISLDNEEEKKEEFIEKKEEKSQFLSESEDEIKIKDYLYDKSPSLYYLQLERKYLYSQNIESIEINNTPMIYLNCENCSIPSEIQLKKYDNSTLLNTINLEINKKKIKKEKFYILHGKKICNACKHELELFVKCNVHKISSKFNNQKNDINFAEIFTLNGKIYIEGAGKLKLNKVNDKKSKTIDYNLKILEFFNKFKYKITCVCKKINENDKFPMKGDSSFQAQCDNCWNTLIFEIGKFKLISEDYSKLETYGNDQYQLYQLFFLKNDLFVNKTGQEIEKLI